MKNTLTHRRKQSNNNNTDSICIILDPGILDVDNLGNIRKRNISRPVREERTKLKFTFSFTRFSLNITCQCDAIFNPCWNQI
jgi:hypothetical protein